MYCKSNKIDDSFDLVTPEVIKEHKSQMSLLNNRISLLKKESMQTKKMIKDEYIPLLKTNVDIIKYIKMKLNLYYC